MINGLTVSSLFLTFIISSTKITLMVLDYFSLRKSNTDWDDVLYRILDIITLVMLIPILILNIWAITQPYYTVMADLLLVMIYVFYIFKEDIISNVHVFKDIVLCLVIVAFTFKQIEFNLQLNTTIAILCLLYIGIKYHSGERII